MENRNPLDWDTCVITNIRRGRGDRAIYMYADLRDKHGNLVVSATLDYIVKVLKERIF